MRVAPWMSLMIALAVEPLTTPDTIAALYPADRGIASDPRVLLAEDFEEGTLDDVSARWTEASNAGGDPLSLVPGSPENAGARCLQATATIGRNTGGHLYRRLDEGVDEAYLRFYVRFPEEAGYVHHFVTLGGYNPPTPWPQGGAGERPAGDDRVTVGIEPTGSYGVHPPPGIWNFYAYWHEMKISADGQYWGNAILPVEPRLVPPGRWQCVEVGLRLNTVGPEGPRRDGELRLWLDGELVLAVAQGTPRGPWTGMGFEVLETGGEPFEGFSFRTTEDLKINFVWLMHYVTDTALVRNGLTPPFDPVTVWFDNVVLATERVGPIAPDLTAYLHENVCRTGQGAVASPAEQANKTVVGAPEKEVAQVPCTGKSRPSDALC